jgi:hypothetical protein
MFLTNVVTGKLGKLVHKQNCSHGIIIVQVRYITIETKKLALLNITGISFRIRIEPSHEYSCGKRNLSTYFVSMRAYIFGKDCTPISAFSAIVGVSLKCVL